ncbi:MAG TPA: PA14 domain-containing protein [Anaerolineae bacterium]|nr:PA14 domain-containing protein [Anaerolineae bacterium]
MRTRRLLLSLALVLGLLGGVLPTASAQGCVATYIVQPGDNLFRIALRFGMTTDVLARANGIFNPNAIYVGQVLCIPGAGTPPPPPPPAPGNCTYYTVKPGDTLGKIAIAYGTSVGALQQANNLRNPNLIYVGMRLCIPGSGSRPPAFPQFRGEYFNNATLAGAASVVRNDSAINFNWGVGWPDPRINADNFSVRWTRTLAFRAGAFRLTARADDGIRVFVDNVLIIDEWHAASSATYIKDVTLASGNHTFRVEYFEATGSASAFFTWARIDGSPAPTPTPGGPTPTPGSGGGSPWTACYFANVNRDVSGQPTLCRYEPAIAVNWGSGSPDPLITPDLFGARWTSTQSLSAGTYRFFALVDDGVRIYVDDEAVINEWFEHNGTTIFGDITLAAGTHTVRVEYFEFAHDAQIYVWWERR